MSNAIQPSEQQTESLRRQMEQFFEATTDAIIFLDRDYNFTFLNRRAKELIGELLGQNLWTVFPHGRDENAPFVENYERSMNHGESTAFLTFYPEPLNMWLSVQSYPAENGILVFFRDVTAETTAQENLERKTEEAERQRAEIEAVYRTAPIGLALFDLDGYHYLRLNDRQAAFFGLKPEDIVGQTVTQMAPIEGLRELFDQVAAGKPVVNYPLEGTLLTDPDDYRYWTVSYFPVYGHDGAVQAITAASLEITQQKKAEQALIQSEKLAVVGRLASSIAHEINNPLEAVTNLLYLARRADTLEDARTLLSSAEIELRRVSAITNQTLRFHKQSSRPQAITAQALLGSVLSIYQGRIANSGVDIQQRHRGEDPVQCFEGEIRQVLSNLVNNALDALRPQGGILTLRSRNATQWKTGKRGVVITVADNGSGMTREIQTKLFNPFFTTKGITGTGLGLWISREIVDRHQGVLCVRSTQSPAHHGTVFTLFLPLEAAAR